MSANVELTQYGFKWGAAEVQRTAEHSGRVAITIKGARGREVTVYVSPQGNSVRIFRDGKEL
jgi:hypothetical protein